MLIKHSLYRVGLKRLQEIGAILNISPEYIEEKYSTYVYEDATKQCFYELLCKTPDYFWRALPDYDKIGKIFVF